MNYSVEKFALKDETDKADIISKMMLKLYDNYKALDLGELFRLRALHEIYATQLLSSYMFRHSSDKNARAKGVVDNLTIGSPAHDFDIDINIAREFGLNVMEMDDQMFIDSKALIRACMEEEEKGEICPFINKEMRIPFFKLFPYVVLNPKKS